MFDCLGVLLPHLFEKNIMDFIRLNIIKIYYKKIFLIKMEG